MIVAIERTKFTYLYKYNQIRVDINQLIDKSIDDLQVMFVNELDKLIQLLNTAIPLFEQDHEIIFLEIDKSKLSLENGVFISFDSVHRIYPLTSTGLQLLSGKINDDFIIELPVFEEAIETLRIKRSMVIRKSTSQKLLAHYGLGDLEQQDALISIEASVEKNLQDKKKPQSFFTFLDHLIAFNKTPSYIPDGNVEFLCKIGVVAIKYLGKSEEVFTNGPFYKSIVHYKTKINSHSILTSYIDFNGIFDEELKLSIKKMADLISKDFNDVDIFKVSYFFLAFKSFLNKHENNIELLNNEIEALIANDRRSASMVITMIGYAFSFENIYEGLHKLCHATILKSSHSKSNIKGKKLHQGNKTAVEKVDGLEKVAFSNSEFNSESVIVIPDGSISEAFVIYENKEENDKVEGGSHVNEIDDKSAEKNDNEEKDVNVAEKAIGENQETFVNKDLYLVEINSDEQLFVAPETETKGEVLTVEVFKSFLSKEISKTKRNIWFQFLDAYFFNNQEVIGLEDILLRLDVKPEEKDKLLKTKKDKDLIKEFFASRQNM